jgi:predicted O-linked N-acetylglucosamine transferase (SPINDLY family)
MKIALFDSQWEYTLDTPYLEPLGGTQSAIAYFLEEMKIKNHDVYLFNKRSTVDTYRGVPHVPANTFLQYIVENKLVFDLVIVSCLPNELVDIKSNLNSPTTLFCLWTGHDIDQVPSKLLKDIKLKDMVDRYIFVSEWQRMRYIMEYNIEYTKTMVMRNGIGKPFEKYLDMTTNKRPNSMTYCSIPWRGLEMMLPIFKTVKGKYNDSTFNIYSGMNIYKQQENDMMENKYTEFKTMEGVTHSYGVSQTQLAEALYNIEYLTYPNTFQETSCITALQAMACGCMVVTSNLGALKETMNDMNMYVDINVYNFDPTKYLNDFLMKLDQLISLPNNIKEQLRQSNREHIKLNYTWNVICSKFEKEMDEITSKHKTFMEKDYKENLLNAIKLFAEGKFVESYNLFSKMNIFSTLYEYYIVKLNTGVCLFQFKQLEASKTNFKLAKTIKNDFNVNKNLALLELQREDLHKFLKYGREALNIEFDTFLANLMAEKLDELGNYHEAIGLYSAINRIEPTNINCLNNLGNMYLLMLSQLDSIDRSMEETYYRSLEMCVKMNEHRKKELVLSNIIFNNLYNWNLTEKEIFEKATVWYKYFPKDGSLVNIVNQLNRNKINGAKIRVGYISTDFITHPVGFMFDSILKNHNMDKFELFCYDNSSKSASDVTSKKLRDYNNAVWRSVFDKTDAEILTMMVNDNLDILVDMMGHTRNTRMNVLQYKPAKILISYFAYPSTNGLLEVDYKFTDKYATPPNTQKYFSEKLYYLPNGFQCYTPPQEIDATKNYNRDSKYPIHLCCFNNPIKLSIPTIETFSEIMKKLPGAKLILRYCYYKSSYYKESIVRLFVKYGVEKERIDIGFEPLLDALRAYNNVDIALDPFPYNGGTISSEALYMNTPFITLAGTNYVSRVGVSLLSNLGLEKYIANTRDEYVDKVVKLAKNQTELRKLHQTLRHRMMNSDLANSCSFTKHIEDAYEDMVTKYNKKK